jgi:hypothetical protein
MRAGGRRTGSGAARMNPAIDARGATHLGRMRGTGASAAASQTSPSLQCRMFGMGERNSAGMAERIDW